MAAFGVLFSALIVVLFLVDLRARYHGAIDQAKRDALDHAQILADNTAVTFETVDRVLRETELIRQGASSGGDATLMAANAALRHLDQTSPIVVAIGWTNATGDVLAAGEPPLGPAEGEAMALALGAAEGARLSLGAADGGRLTMGAGAAVGIGVRKPPTPPSRP